eukprot:CAMPEP_0179108206 /NCGR_PEP_ID=MMETSP0796-20121207/50393_1 /TAXON_ID=73915 /ORGANISM="Pyrodinium bahamense, Strain pbaha01" /LENGTH=243 /DNA_ID=CAMNT_0020806275 /DNA_START=315 /DNA_END=1043 /DNA_ORIENTATION=+
MTMFTSGQGWQEAWAEVGLSPKVEAPEGPYPSLFGEVLIQQIWRHLPSMIKDGMFAGFPGWLLQNEAYVRRAMPQAVADASGRCWWIAKEYVSGPATSEWVYEGAAESLNLLAVELKRRGPLDCIIGFSQGALLTALCLECLQEAPCRAVFISGFRPRDPDLAALLLPSSPGQHGAAAARTLHVMGKRDRVVPRDESYELYGWLCQSMDLPSSVSMREAILRGGATGMYSSAFADLLPRDDQG